MVNDSAPCTDRRKFLQTSTSLAGVSLSLPAFLGLRSAIANEADSRQRRAGTGAGRAKSCIILFCWGGISQLESWDPKPDAERNVRGEFNTIPTATPGIRVSEHIPLLAKQTGNLAIVRSVHHDNSAHGKGMYWNMTGHAPRPGGGNQPPSPEDWPSIGAMTP